MRNLKYVKLFENFENVKYPNSIRVKLTDTFEETHKIDKPRKILEVDLSNNPESYKFIGRNLHNGVFYFASRKDNLIFITGVELQQFGQESIVSRLIFGDPVTKYEINAPGLRSFESGTCTLGEHNNPDYRGELRVGMTDHRGYFEIVSMK